MAPAGGKLLCGGSPSKFYDNGVRQRFVVTEFDSVDAATRAHDSPAYQAALAALGDGADRAIRIVEGAT